MGKYKQWLHHQEVGRRLREQISTYESERERVQRMAPSHPTTLPDTTNPLIRALLDYTSRGNMLGRAVKGTGESQQRQPAEIAPTADRAASVPNRPAAPPPSLAGAPTFTAQVSMPPAAPVATDNPIVARLAANAAAMPADPLEAMRQLAQQSHDAAPPASGASPTPSEAPSAAESQSEWWQRYRSQQSS